MRAQEDLLFLLAESYYRLGMRDAFRKTAASLDSAAPGSRYTGVIAAQRMLDAYSRGDYARVRTLAASKSAGDRGLMSLVAGLAAVQTRDYPAAHAAFAEAQQHGGEFALYAQYMDALATAASDSTKGPAALATLQSLSESARGTFAEQVRLSAAQTALGIGQFDAAASLADGVPATSGAGAQALAHQGVGALSRRQHRRSGDRLSRVRDELSRICRRATKRGSWRDRSCSRAARATRPRSIFRASRTRSAASSAHCRRARASAMTDASRALVNAHLAGSVFIANAGSGKIISLPDDAGAEKPRIAAAFAGASDTGLVTASPHILSSLGIAARVDSAAGAGFPVRVVFAPRTDAQPPGAYADRTQAVLATDIELALASYRLQEQIDAQKTKIEALENLQRLIVEGDSALAENAKQIAATQDSLEQMKGVLDEHAREGAQHAAPADRRHAQGRGRERSPARQHADVARRECEGARARCADDGAADGRRVQRDRG